MKNFLAWSWLLLLLAACGSSSPYDKYLEAPDCPSAGNTSIQLIQSKTLATPVPNDSYNHHRLNHLVKHGDSLYYYGLEGRRRKLVVFNLTSQKYIKTINLKEDPSIRAVGPFYVQSPDSIFMSNEIPASVMLLNGEGKVQQKWKLDDAPIEWSIDYEFNYSFENLTRHHAPIYKDGKLHLMFTPVDYWLFQNKSELQLHGWYDVAAQKWGTVYGMPQGILLENDIEYPYMQSLPYQLVVGKKVYVSYQLNHDIFVYDMETGKLLDTKCGSSQHLPKLQEPDVENADIQERTNSMIEGGTYLALNYHADIEVFTRIVSHPKPLLNAEGQQTAETERSLSIIFFDKDLNKIGEQKFEKNTLAIDAALVTSDGFILAGLGENSTDDDHLRYNYQYKIQLK